MKRAIALTVVGAVALLGYAQYNRSVADDKAAAAAAIALVVAPDMYGKCLPKVHATVPRYTAADLTVPHAPATVTYDAPGGHHLVIAVVAAKRASFPADSWSTWALGKAGC